MLSFARSSLATFVLAAITCCAAACSQPTHDPSTVSFLIESNPGYRDPRFATDSPSQRIDGLLFSSLVDRDDRMNLRRDLAESWSPPDPRTHVFHLRRGVRFYDGQLLTSADVKATLNFIPNVAHYAYDPARAEKLLGTAGFSRKQNGVGLNLTLSAPPTRERASLAHASRNNDPASASSWKFARSNSPFFSRTSAAEIFSSRINAGLARIPIQNFFKFAFSSKRFSPDRANRGHYCNPRMDARTDQIRVEMNREKR